MDQEAIFFIQQLNICGRKIQAVGDQGFFINQIKLTQADQQVLAVFVMAERDVITVFRRMDMQAASADMAELLQVLTEQKRFIDTH